VKHGFRQGSSGEATIPVVPGSNHCSLTKPAIAIRWEIEFLFDVQALDEKGFLFDAVTFTAYWQALATEGIDYSCELLAYRTLTNLLDMLGERAKYVQHSHIRIYPFGATFAEYFTDRD
jgi:hypothetical protein